MRYRPEIMKTHPTLFWIIVLLASINFVVGAAMFIQDPMTLINFKKVPEEPLIPPLQFYGALWILSGIMFLYGLQGNGTYKWTRRGLVISSIVGGYWAFGFVISYFSGNILGISGPVCWTAYTILCVIMTHEPVINPLAAVISNGKNGSALSRDR